MIQYSDIGFWDRIRLKNIKVGNYKTYSKEFLKANPNEKQVEEAVDQTILDWWYNLTLKERINQLNSFPVPAESIEELKQHLANPYMVEDRYQKHLRKQEIVVETIVL